MKGGRVEEAQTIAGGCCWRRKLDACSKLLFKKESASD